MHKCHTSFIVGVKLVFTGLIKYEASHLHRYQQPINQVTFQGQSPFYGVDLF